MRKVESALTLLSHSECREQSVLAKLEISKSWQTVAEKQITHQAFAGSSPPVSCHIKHLVAIQKKPTLFSLHLWLLHWEKKTTKRKKESNREKVQKSKAKSKIKLRTILTYPLHCLFQYSPPYSSFFSLFSPWLFSLRYPLPLHGLCISILP